MGMGQPSADSRVEGRSCQQIASLRLVVVRVPPLALWVLVVSARHLSWRYGLAISPSPGRRKDWTQGALRPREALRLTRSGRRPINA